MNQEVLKWLVLILEERFGYKFDLDIYNNTLILSYFPGKKKIIFDRLDPIFNCSISDFSCHQWCASLEGFVGIISDELFMPSSVSPIDKLVELNDLGATVHYDILGLVYWMMNRIEEIGRDDLDAHNRFPAIHSHAYKHNYLDRPIVDEWLDILGQIILKVWPELALRKHQFSMKVSHDVDFPSEYAFKSWSYMPRAMARHLLKEKSWKKALLAPYVKLATEDVLHPYDPSNVFDWLMDISEENNLKSAFYFIAGRTEPSRDSDYNIEHPIIRNLLRKIHQRGHEIGLHPSYLTYKNPELIRQECQKLKQVCLEEDIHQNIWGGRMHYLRWEHPTTLLAWENAKLAYDTTLGYADIPGFRCGTCFEYPAYDPVNHKVLNIRVRPLIVMECSVLAEHYLNLSITKEAEEYFLHLKRMCYKVNGCFTLLWHNSYFHNDNLFGMYEKVIIFNEFN